MQTFVIGMTFSISMEHEVYKIMISGYSYHITLISKSSFCCPFICICTTIQYSHAFRNNKNFERKGHLHSIKTNELQILSKPEKASEHNWNREHSQKHSHKNVSWRALKKIYTISNILFKSSMMVALSILSLIEFFMVVLCISNDKACNALWRSIQEKPSSFLRNISFEPRPKSYQAGHWQLLLMIIEVYIFTTLDVKSSLNSMWIQTYDPCD